MTAYYEIRTMSGARFLIHELGMIERTDMPFTPTMNWRVTSIRGRLMNMSVVLPENWHMFLQRNPPMLYKNGTARWVIRDFDHGTHLQWGDHLKSIREL